MPKTPDDRSASFEVTVRVYLHSIVDGKHPTCEDAKEVVESILNSGIDDCMYWNGKGLQPDSFNVETYGAKYAVEVK